MWLLKRTSTKSETTVHEPRLLTIPMAAAYLSSSVWAIRQLVWARKIPHLVIGRRILFDKADLDRYVESQKVPARI